ncbi:Uncharacterised protein [Vibrio cholerae]|nr:Uncharacterised protein [Vibrio cholerae]CSD34445.1 Uncharacterised protein [Vibrio cholerae]CSI45780.1 Uncharacterised protein [Vibrio cholerae]
MIIRQLIQTNRQCYAGRDPDRSIEGECQSSTAGVRHKEMHGEQINHGQGKKKRFIEW